MENNNKNNSWVAVVGVIAVIVILGIILWPQISGSDATDIVDDVPLIGDEREQMEPNDNNQMTDDRMMDDTPDQEDEDMSEDMPAVMPDVTSVNEILAVQDPQVLVDQSADIQDVRVQSVPSDRVFFVGTSLQNSVPVLLDEDLSPETEIEGQVNIQVGQTVSFTGVIYEVPSESEILDLLGITQNDAEALLGNSVYIFVQGTDVVVE